MTNKTLINEYFTLSISDVTEAILEITTSFSSPFEGTVLRTTTESELPWHFEKYSGMFNKLIFKFKEKIIKEGITTLAAQTTQVVETSVDIIASSVTQYSEPKPVQQSGRLSKYYIIYILMIPLCI